MLQTNRARELASAVQLIEFVAEDDPRQSPATWSDRHSQPLFFAARSDGIEKVAQQAMPRDLNNLLEWVNWTTGTAATVGRSAVDPALERASHPGILTVQPSPQSPQSPVYPVPSYAPAQTLKTIPVVTTPAAPPVVISMTSPPVYIQQAAPTVVLGPAPPPDVIVPSTPLLPHTFDGGRTRFCSHDDHSESSNPVAGNGGNESPSSNAVRGATGNGGTGSAPQQSAGLALILSEPNMVDRMIGALGRLLAQRGLPRLQMNPGTPATFTPSVLPLSQAGVPGGSASTPATLLCAATSSSRSAGGACPVTPAGSSGQCFAPRSFQSWPAIPTERRFAAVLVKTLSQELKRSSPWQKARFAVIASHPTR